MNDMEFSILSVGNTGRLHGIKYNMVQKCLCRLTTLTFIRIKWLRHQEMQQWNIPFS